MANWDVRYQEADEQNRRYSQKSIQEKEMNQEEVAKQIGKWIEDSKLDDIVSKPMTIEFEELNSLVIKRELENGDKVVRGNVQRKVKEIESQIWMGAFDKKGEIRDNTKHYIWVTFRSDGMVVTVGKTNMKTGDLLKYEGIYGSNTGNTKIVTRQLVTSSERDRFDELNRKIYQYTQSALVMGINLTLNDKKEGEIYQVKNKASNSIPIILESESNSKLSYFAQKLETQLGEYLLDNKISILNRYSHMGG